MLPIKPSRGTRAVSTETIEERFIVAELKVLLAKAQNQIQQLETNHLRSSKFLYLFVFADTPALLL